MSEKSNDYCKEHTTKNGHKIRVTIEKDKKGNIPGVKSKNTSDIIISAVSFLFDFFGKKK